MLRHTGLAQLADAFISDPRRHFTEGQSVRAQVRLVRTFDVLFAMAHPSSLRGM